MIIMRDFAYQRGEKVSVQFIKCIDVDVIFVERNIVLYHLILRFIMMITEAELKMGIIAKYIVIVIKFHRFNGELSKYCRSMI